jgi:glycerol kinase
VESLAYQTNDLIAAMKQEAGLAIDALRVDGGASANDFLMQFQADISGLRIERPRCVETTALGAAYLAGLAVGYWGSIDEIKGQWQVEKAFSPQADPQRVSTLCAGWADAIGRTVNCNQ